MNDIDNSKSTRKEMSTGQKLGFCACALVFSISFILSWYLINNGLIKHGSAIVCFGPTKALKENIKISGQRGFEFSFTNGEKSKSVILNAYLVICMLLWLLCIYCLIRLQCAILACAFGIDIILLMKSGEWRKKEKKPSCES
jgi:hypothetical protein